VFVDKSLVLKGFSFPLDGFLEIARGCMGRRESIQQNWVAKTSQFRGILGKGNRPWPVTNICVRASGQKPGQGIETLRVISGELQSFFTVLLCLLIAHLSRKTAGSIHARRYILRFEPNRSRKIINGSIYVSDHVTCTTSVEKGEVFRRVKANYFSKEINGFGIITTFKCHPPVMEKCFPLIGDFCHVL